MPCRHVPSAAPGLPLLKRHAVDNAVTSSEKRYSWARTRARSPAPPADRSTRGCGPANRSAGFPSSCGRTARDGSAAPAAARPCLRTGSHRAARPMDRSSRRTRRRSAIFRPRRNYRAQSQSGPSRHDSRRRRDSPDAAPSLPASGEPCRSPCFRCSAGTSAVAAAAARRAYCRGRICREAPETSDWHTTSASECWRAPAGPIRAADCPRDR